MFKHLNWNALHTALRDDWPGPALVYLFRSGMTEQQVRAASGEDVDAFALLGALQANARVPD